jgi:flagellar motor switch protein FliN
MDGMLSQDEINALLSGMNTGGDDTSDSSTATTTIPEDNANDNTDGGFTLTESEKDAVGEISNISMGTAATTLSSLLSQKVNITTPKVEVATWDDLSSKYDRPCVMLQISYKEGLAGNNVLILRENDVKIITDLMMGGPGNVDPDEPLTELHLSAIGEAMNQMMGSAATSLSSMFNRKIDISPPIANLVETYNELDDNTDGGFTLTESEKDAVGEISNISMGTAATTLSSLLSQKVNITTPKRTGLERALENSE